MPQWGLDHYWSYFHSINLKWKWEAIITVFNITIITWWPFISHSLGTLVKAGVLKVSQVFFLFLSERGTCLSFDLCLCFVCSLYSYFLFLFQLSGCPTVQEQSPEKRAFTDLSWRGNHNLCLNYNHWIAADTCHWWHLIFAKKKKTWYIQIIIFLEKTKIQIYNTVLLM